MPRKTKEYKYNFIYKIINTKNSKFYIGMHSTDNLNDGYLGGGKRIRNSIRRHGKECHVLEILEYYPDRISLARREGEIVNEYLLQNPLCMNLAIGGDGGGDGFKGYRESLKDPAKRKGINEKLKRSTKKAWEDGKFNMIDLNSFKNSFCGKNHNNETKKVMSDKASLRVKEKNSQFGTCWITNETEDRKILLSDLDYYITSGWRRGRNKKCNEKKV